MQRTRALLRPPEPGFGCARSRADSAPVDAELACAQWEALRATLERAGWYTIVVTSATGDPPCPEGVFIGDTVGAVAGHAFLARSPHEHRRPERAAVRRTLLAVHIAPTSIRRPGILDVGDVLRVGDRVHVGVGGRTNRAGLAQVVDALRSTRLRIVPTPVTKAVHLAAAVSALPDGTVLGYPPLVDDPSVFDEFVPVPEPAGATVLPLDAHRVLMASSAPRSAQVIADLGFDPVIVDIGEFEKRDGTVACLCAPL